MIDAKACLLSAAVVAVCAGVGAADNTYWNLRADFSISAGNPHRGWTYGAMDHAFTTLTPYTETFSDTGWREPGNGTGAHIWKNYSESYSFGVPGGHVSLHPASDTRPSVARWTCPPVAPGAWIRITGGFMPGDIGAMATSVRVNGVQVWNDSGNFDLTPDIATGGTVDFCVYGGWAYGNTPLDTSILLYGTLVCTADIGMQGGLPGADGVHDNNDFVVFIAHFFGADARADRGVQGGQPGADGLFDNNDFVVYINQFFAGC